MPKMSRQQYSAIADATNAILKEVEKVVGGEALATLRMNAARSMTNAMIGMSSTFNGDRFYERCLGIRRGR